MSQSRIFPKSNSDSGPAKETTEYHFDDSELCSKIKKLILQWATCLYLSRDRFFCIKTFISKSYLAKLDYYNSRALVLKELKKNDKFLNELKVNEKKRLKEVSSQVNALKKLWTRCCKSSDTFGTRLADLELDKAKFELNLNQIMNLKGRTKWIKLQSLVKSNSRPNKDFKWDTATQARTDQTQSLNKNFSAVVLKVERIYEKNRLRLENFQNDFLNEIDYLCKCYNEIENGQEVVVNTEQKIPNPQILEEDEEWFNYDPSSYFRTLKNYADNPFKPIDSVSYHKPDVGTEPLESQQSDFEKSSSNKVSSNDPEDLTKAIEGSNENKTQIYQESWDILKNS